MAWSAVESTMCCISHRVVPLVKMNQRPALHGHVDTGHVDAGERERDLYFSVVTGTYYETKTPPDQQPTKLCAEV